MTSAAKAAIDISSLACRNLNLDLDIRVLPSNWVPSAGAEAPEQATELSRRSRDLWLCVPASRRVCLWPLKLLTGLSNAQGYFFRGVDAFFGALGLSSRANRARGAVAQIRLSSCRADGCSVSG